MSLKELHRGIDRIAFRLKISTQTEKKIIEETSDITYDLADFLWGRKDKLMLLGANDEDFLLLDAILDCEVGSYECSRFRSHKGMELIFPVKTKREPLYCMVGINYGIEERNDIAVDRIIFDGQEKIGEDYYSLNAGQTGFECIFIKSGVYDQMGDDFVKPYDGGVFEIHKKSKTMFVDGMRGPFAAKCKLFQFGNIKLNDKDYVVFVGIKRGYKRNSDNDSGKKKQPKKVLNPEMSFGDVI